MESIKSAVLTLYMFAAMFAGFVFGLAAGFMLLFLPVAFRHPAIFEAIKFDSRDSVLATPMRWYGHHLLEYANRLEQQAKNNPGKM